MGTLIDRDILDFAKDIEVSTQKEKIQISFNDFQEMSSETYNHLKSWIDLIESNKPSNNIERKFTDTINIEDYEIETDKGWKDCIQLGKTVPYKVWVVKTQDYILRCADTHILFDSEYDEIFVKDLNKDSRPDKIITQKGPQVVLEVYETDEVEEMFDIQLSEDSDHRYWTSGILSHNSIWLANDAANFIKMGYNTAFISAEMSPYKVIKRIGSNLLSIPMDEYDTQSHNTELIKRKLGGVSRGLLPPGKLFIKEFPTSQATVPDVEAYLKELEETNGFKLKAIVIDYINILANYRNMNTENTYMKIKQIAEDLRAMAVRNDWLIVSATQINRGGYASTDISLEHISESAGLSHTCDMIYGIIQDEVMHSNKEYFLKILKLRDGDGKGTKCRFEINYNFMRLTETADVLQTD